MERAQLNLRISEALGQIIDAKRIELSKSWGTIPSRSDVVRQALAEYLQIDISQTDTDGRKTRRKNAS